MPATPRGGIFDLFPKEVIDFLQMEQLEDVLDLQELSIRLAKDPTFINAFDKKKNMSDALKAKIQKYKKQKRNFLATIQGQTGSGKCLVGTDFVFYSRKNKVYSTMIKDAYEHYKKDGFIYVPSVNPECKVEWLKATVVEVEEDRELIHTKTDSGKECTTTVDHSYILFDDDFNIVSKRGDELDEGDRLITVLNIDFPELDITDKIYDGPDLRENGQLFGSYIADGNICNNHARISKYDHMAQWRPLSDIIEKAQGEYIQRGFSLENKMQDIGTGSAVKQIPTWFFGAPREFREGVLDGWLSCDGEVTIRKQKRKPKDKRTEHLVYNVNIMTKSKRLAEQGVILFATLGIRVYVRKKNGPLNSDGADYRDNVYYIIDFSSSELPKLAEIVTLHRGKQRKLKSYVSKGFLAQDYKDQFPVNNEKWKEIGRKYRLNRKVHNGEENDTLRKIMIVLGKKRYVGRRKYIEMIDTIIDMEPSAIEEKYIQKIYSILTNGDIYLDKIVSIERLPPTTEKLYDLCVPGTENFMLANGLFVHNSYTMLSIAHLISGEVGFTIDNIFFRLSDAIRAFDTLEPGSTILIDERTRIWGAGAYRIAAEWQNFTEVIRKFQINILNSTPREMMDVLYTNRFETMPCQIDYVKEFARVAIQDQKKNTLGWIAVRHPKHTVGDKFIKEYEKRKDGFLLDIMKHSDKGHIRSLADEFMECETYKYLLERFPSGPKYNMIFEAVDQKYPHLQRNQEVAEIARKVEYVQVMEMGMKSTDEKRQERKFQGKDDIDREQKELDQFL